MQLSGSQFDGIVVCSSYFVVIIGDHSKSYLHRVHIGKSVKKIIFVLSQHVAQENNMVFHLWLLVAPLKS